MTTTAPTMSIDLSSRAVNADPFPVMNAVREAGPAVFNDTIQRWMVGRYDESRALLADADGFAQDGQFFDDIFGARLFIADDNPRHNERRGIWNPSFLRRGIEPMRGRIDEIVDDQVARFVDALAAEGTVDATTAFANAIPPLVISEMLGVDEDDISRFSRWSQEMNLIAESVVEGPTERGAQLREVGFAASASMCAYARAQIDARAGGDGGDLVSLLARSPLAADMTPAAQEGHIAMLTLAGHETTAKLLGHMLVILARHPEQRAALREDRTLIPQAVEEIIRVAGVIGAAVREARRDVQVGDVTIPAGAQVFVLPTAANRDPRRWEDPDTFDIFREAKAHLGFGFGTHSCLGLNLARLEAAVVLDRVLDALPDYRLADDEIDYGTSWFVRGPTAVMISAS